MCHQKENVRRNAAGCQTNIKTCTYITVALSMSHGIQIEHLLQLRSSVIGSLGNDESWEMIHNRRMNSYFGFFDAFSIGCEHKQININL